MEKKTKKSLKRYLCDFDSIFTTNYFLKKFQCEHVEGLWYSIGCRKPVYNIKMQGNDRKAIEKYIGIFNALAQESVNVDKVVEEISKYPQFERERLCKLVKNDMQERNPGNMPIDEKEFIVQTASISNIALSEGISPSALYVLCVMNYDKYFKERLVNS